MHTTKIEGKLEIDHERGVIYFHNTEGCTTLRICSLPTPIPEPNEAELYQLDITHMYGASWRGEKE